MDSNDAIQDGNSSEELETDQQQESEQETDEIEGEGSDNSEKNSEGKTSTEQKVAAKKSDTTKDEKKQLAKELAQEHDDYLVTIKVDGKEQKIPLKDLKKNVQLEQASRKRMQESDQVMKSVESAMKLLKSNPKEFLRRTGLDPVKFAEDVLVEKYTRESLTEEQRKLLETEEKLKSYEEKEKEREQKEQQEKLSAAEVEEMKKLDVEIGEAFKDSGLPKHPYFAAQIAFKMLSASKQGKDLQAKEAVSMIKGEFNKSVREIVQNLDANAIQEILGQDVLAKLRDADVKRVQSKNSETIRQKQGPVTQTASQTKKPMTEREWRKQIDALADSYS